MNKPSVSSAELIGSQADNAARSALLMTEEAFALKARAQELTERLADVPQYPRAAYIGLMALGPFALLSPTLLTVAVNKVQRTRIDRLHKKAETLLSKSQGND